MGWIWQSRFFRFTGRRDLQLQLAEYNGSNALLRRYVHGPGVDEPLVWYQGTGTTDRRWLHADERGSIVAISNASGAATTINAYDEYGIPQATNAGRFQYTGQQWLPELGMYHYKARIYSPTLGRFLQTDPIGYGDGMNLYAYVRNDPVNFTDPLGLKIVVTGQRTKNPNPFWLSGGVGSAAVLADFNPDVGEEYCGGGSCELIVVLANVEATTPQNSPGQLISVVAQRPRRPPPVSRPGLRNPRDPESFRRLWEFLRDNIPWVKSEPAPPYRNPCGGTETPPYPDPSSCPEARIR